MAEALGESHWVRGLDVRPFEGCDENVVGDLCSLDDCRSAVEGIDAVVFCHMAPRPGGNKTNADYEEPGLPIDVNVKGTANLYHAMAEREIKRAVMVSTMGVLANRKGATAAVGDGPYAYRSHYGFSKVLQEQVARFYHEAREIVTTILRPSHIIFDGTLVTKYGKKAEKYSPNMVDPRDLGRAASMALALSDPKLESFEIAQDDAKVQLDPIRERLGWRAKYTFESLRGG